MTPVNWFSTKDHVRVMNLLKIFVFLMTWMLCHHWFCSYKQKLSSLAEKKSEILTPNIKKTNVVYVPAFSKSMWDLSFFFGPSQELEKMRKLGKHLIKICLGPKCSTSLGSPFSVFFQKKNKNVLGPAISKMG